MNTDNQIPATQNEAWGFWGTMNEQATSEAVWDAGWHQVYLQVKESAILRRTWFMKASSTMDEEWLTEGR